MSRDNMAQGGSWKHVAPDCAASSTQSLQHKEMEGHGVARPGGCLRIHLHWAGGRGCKEC